MVFCILGPLVIFFAPLGFFRSSGCDLLYQLTHYFSNNHHEICISIFTVPEIQTNIEYFSNKNAICKKNILGIPYLIVWILNFFAVQSG